MEKIASFTIDHLKLLPGVYVSRKDKVGQQVITTFDIRMTRPNFEPVLNTAEVQLHLLNHNHQPKPYKILFLILQKFIQLSILAQHF